MLVKYLDSQKIYVASVLPSRSAKSDYLYVNLTGTGNLAPARVPPSGNYRGNSVAGVLLSQGLVPNMRGDPANHF